MSFMRSLEHLDRLARIIRERAGREAGGATRPAARGRELSGLEPAPGAPPAWREWVGAALDLLFPPFCPVCRQLLGHGRQDPLCGHCWSGLERIVPPLCRRCGTQFFRFPEAPEELSMAGGGCQPAPAPEHLCGRCRHHPPVFSYARSAARYGDVVREALHAFKFGGRRALAAPLGALLGETRHLLPTERVDLLVPVPLHPRREQARGFNQALLLARRLEATWGPPVGASVLRRTADTASQTDLSANRRRANVRGAFALGRPEQVTGRHVLLVDDIMTTGATVSECAACLWLGGATTVGVVTVARVL